MCSFNFSLARVNSQILLVGKRDDLEKISRWQAWRLARRLGVKTKAIFKACRQSVGCAKQVPSYFDGAIDKLAEDGSFYDSVCAPIGVMDARDGQSIHLFPA